MGIMLTGLLLFAAGLWVVENPAVAGGNLQLERGRVLFRVRCRPSANPFVVENVRRMGIGIVVGGILVMLFGAVSLFFPEVRGIFG